MLASFIDTVFLTECWRHLPFVKSNVSVSSVVAGAAVKTANVAPTATLLAKSEEKDVFKDISNKNDFAELSLALCIGSG
jgi:hypothetical protein